MQCEMCGTDTNLVKTSIEGSELNVCNKCANFGKIINKPRTIVFKPKPATFNKNSSLTLSIIPNYASVIKSKRESLELNQEDLAKKLNEKWSVIQKIESNSFKPSFDLARKLERFLKIELVEQIKEEQIENIKQSSEVFTLGDIIKQKLIK